MASMHRGAFVVIMPNYFGSTILPPLDAWAFGKQLIYSYNLMEEEADAALLADIDSAD
jgi:hypothetical protein